MCVSVCLSVCLAAMGFRTSAPAATKLHIHALKISPGRFVSQCRSARLIERALSEGPLLIAAMASCTTAKHDCLAKHKLATPLRARTQITAAQKSAAAAA